DFVQKRLFDPLGMKTATCTTTAALKLPDVAGPHRLNKAGVVQVMPRYVLSAPDAAGSIHASARDLAKWLRFHLDGGMAGEKRLVPKASLAETHTPQFVIRPAGAEREMFPDTVQLSYGLGWVLHDYRGYRVLAHGGATDGFRAQLTFVPEQKLGVVLLCNLH